jgi:putative transcriptional regulator
MLRDTAGLSQGQLAAAMSVSRQTINSIETGRYTPSLPLAMALARFFDRAVEEIFHGDDDAQRVPQPLVMPGFSVALGVAMLVAGWAGGDLGFGVFGLGLMTALGAVFLLGSGRSETLSGLGRARPRRAPGGDRYARHRRGRSGPDRGGDRSVAVGDRPRPGRVSIQPARRDRRDHLRGCGGNPAVAQLS